MTEPARPSAEDILGHLDARASLQALHDQHDAAAAAGWDSDPAPLTARRLLPSFPVDALPTWLAEQVAAVAEFTQTPTDLAGSIALAALSAATAGRARVEVRAGWVEPCNLYTAVAMPPGSRKSAVFAAMTAPLLAAETQLRDQLKPVIAQAVLAKQTAQRDAEKSANAAAATNSPEARADALNQATADALAADEITVPTTPQLIADDVTTEAAASLLAEQGGRLAVLSAEGGIFSILAGRYTSGAPSLEVFLKGHAGDLLRVNRKGRDAEHIAAPALTLGLAIQPEVLRDIARIPGFRGRGLLARILYALPENTVGHRNARTNPVPTDVYAADERNLRDRVRTRYDHTEPAALALTAAADETVLALQEAIEPRLAETGDLGHLADWASKLTGATVRVAGLLHLATHLRDGRQRPIDSETVEAAARIGHYYTAHALAVFDLMGADPTIDDAHVILDWIARNRPERFTKRQLFTGVSRARFRKVGDLEPALDLLEQHGHVRRGEQPASTGGRRPSVPFEVHPCIAQAAEVRRP
ncbi:MAG: YfjI family protein [Sciscionella sp.]